MRYYHVVDDCYEKQNHYAYQGNEKCLSQFFKSRFGKDIIIISRYGMKHEPEQWHSYYSDNEVDIMKHRLIIIHEIRIFIEFSEQEEQSPCYQGTEPIC